MWLWGSAATDLRVRSNRGAKMWRPEGERERPLGGSKWSCGRLRVRERECEREREKEIEGNKIRLGLGFFYF